MAALARAKVLPESLDNNGWYNSLPPLAPARHVVGEQTFEWAVIGAGCCGLAVARRLAEHRPDDRIALIEAERVGYGASGRNAGFLLNIHSHGKPKNLDLLRNNMRLWVAGIEHLRDMVETQQIQCDWSDWGRLYCAAGPDGETHMGELVATFDRLGLDYERLDGSGIESLTGTTYYTRGLRAPGSVLVQPAALMRGLARSMPANVTIFEESPVTEIHRNRPFRLVCPGGTVGADVLVLANGAFLSEFGFYRHRYVPIAHHASLTRVLSQSELSSFGSAREFGLLSSSQNGSTVRLTRDGRLFMRNRITYNSSKRFDPASIATIQDGHRESIRQRWPALAEVEIADTWGGFQAYTRNDGIIFGRLADKLYAIVTSDVAPVTRGTIKGRLLADYIVGIGSELLDLVLAMPKAAWLPPDPILRVAVNLRLAMIRAVGAKDM